MKIKWFFILFLLILFTIPYILYPNFVFAQEVNSQETQVESEKERLQKALERMTPESLQNTQKKSVVCTISDFLGLFGCDSEKYQNMIMPETINVSSGGTVQGASESAVLGENTMEGEVKGIQIPVIINNILNFINGVLGDKDKGGAFYFPRPDSLGELAEQEQGTTKTKVIFEKTEKTLLPNSLSEGETPPYIPPEEIVPSIIPTLPPFSGDTSVKSLQDLFVQVENWLGIPWQVVEGIMRVEGPAVFSLSNNEIIQYSQSGARYLKNCLPNDCSAAGPMQFTTGGTNIKFDIPSTTAVEGCPAANSWKENILFDASDGILKNSCFAKAANNLGISNIREITDGQAEQIVRVCWPNKWAQFGSAVNEALGEGRTTNVCNIKDTVFATGKMLDYTKQIRVQYCNANRDHYRYCCAASDSWQDENLVKCVATVYYGECETTFARLNNKTYCDFVWDYYQAKKGEEAERVEGTENTVDNLVNGVDRVCIYEDIIGRVNTNNVGCLEAVESSIESAARSILRSSAIVYEDLQCVAFAVVSERVTSGGFLETAGRINAAIDYARNEPQGFQFINKTKPARSIKTGDYLLWNIGAYGHIAYVQRIYDTNNVQVAEANWAAPGAVRRRNVVLDNTGIIGWLGRL